MADVDNAFATFLGWLVPTGGDTAAAASHRASIKSCLETSFGMTSIFRTGSFGHGTSVSGFSDIDYFAVIPREKLRNDSNSTLQEMRTALRVRFPRTEIHVRSPSVIVPFGNSPAEKHEITPADYLQMTKASRVYDIPDRHGGWMKASPSAHNAYVNYHHERLNNRLKGLIRLVKAWNYYRNGGLRSFYLEFRVTEYAASEAAIVYKYDFVRALRHIRNKQAAAIQDPMEISGYIYPCSAAAKENAISKIETAIGRAEKALDLEDAGKIRDAFEWWDMVFDNQFPAYR